MPVKVVMLPDVGKVTFSQNSRSVRMKLSVRSNRRVLVSFPPHVSFRDAAHFALEHTDWILQQQKKHDSGSENFIPDVPLKTRYHLVNIQPDGDKFYVRQKKFDIHIGYPASISLNNPQVKEFVERILTSVYRWEAQKYLPARLALFSEKYGLPFNKLTIRNNRSNWGSCSSGNNISLNLNLMKLPDHLIDYIILHELAHTKIRNHGPDFWRFLDSLTEGRAREWNREVKKYSCGIPLT